MARAGVTDGDIIRAAERVFERDGITPTVQSVRIELGNTGSPNTIGPILKRWKENKDSQKIAGVPAHLIQSLKSIYEQIEVDKNNELRSIRKIHDSLVEELHKENDKLQLIIGKLNENSKNDEALLEIKSKENKKLLNECTSIRECNIKLEERHSQKNHYVTHIEKQNTELKVRNDNDLLEINHLKEENRKLIIENSKLKSTNERNLEQIIDLKSDIKASAQTIKTLAISAKENSKLFKEQTAKYDKEKQNWNKSKAKLSNELKASTSKYEKTLLKVTGLEKSVKAKSS